MGSSDSHPKPERCRDRGCERYGCLLYRRGHEDGYAEGHDDGWREGYRAGYRDGEHDGYREGLDACARTHKK